MKSGYVAIIGLPNTGKSTLLNAILGEKLSIATKKPQTTRKRVLGIYTDENYQIIFFDTPGVLKPEYLLQQRMLEYVFKSANDADILLFLIDVAADPEGKKTFGDENVQKLLSDQKVKKILILNKIDLSNEEKINHLLEKYKAMEVFEEIYPISAKLDFNVQSVMAALMDRMPEHPKYYPDDRISDEPERFFVSEIIREKLLELYSEEIPYSCEVLIEDFKERAGRKDLISACIVVEKETQKPIIIGKQGLAIKRLGSEARENIEAFLQRPVFLELRVKVRDKWRSNPNMLRSFGYTEDTEE